MLTVKDMSDKEHAIQTLQTMELDQIAIWINILPEDRWKELFVYYWPTLAKKCGIVEKTLVHTS
ncbi:hypothetical protein O9H85_28915 [Paenibacillus filicis]|uniref:Uncharacterized protein n=1 Tax=Paenibacillus gyeongsangnamensis TaxID=3388067 RepID=A0ABT4QHG6_9BACL|nr:hypothetical protein [Paenibacillus filicis]MCZ8516342.1 hypothetical protein [Paenibacillus filicis]